MTFDPQTAARYVFDAHRARAAYRNLPTEIAPTTLAEAYAAQAALAPLLEQQFGPVAGRKIATTTKVMQELMGIDHPCGGLIFARRIHASPARIALADHMHLMIECELALRLGRDLAGTSFTAASVAPAVAAAMPAFELIEDRNADYRVTSALSMIADNCWNAGIVVGPDVPFDPDRPPVGTLGRLAINGSASREGRTEDPLATLAWIANLANGYGRPLTAGMVVITGSVIPTLPIAAGDRFVFSLDGLGGAELTAV
ncbi:MAG TPA: fumarylacetoacetate hydrolase family protein [Xanthobacteraceae bacterium]